MVKKKKLSYTIENGNIIFITKGIGRYVITDNNINEIGLQMKLIIQ